MRVRFEIVYHLTLTLPVPDDLVEQDDPPNVIRDDFAILSQLFPDPDALEILAPAIQDADIRRAR